MTAPLSPFAVAFLVAGLVLFGAAWWAYSRRRHIMDTPTSKVRSMAIGPVELSGVAALPPGRDYLHGPFTGEPCLYWEYKVEEQRTRSTKNGTQTYWATVASDRSRGVIGLRDDTGLVIVDPQGHALPAPTASEYGSGFARDPPPAVVEFLATKGLRHETLFGLNKKMRFTERRLAELTPLYVLGNAIRREGATGSGNEALVVQREGDGAFLVSEKSERQLLLQWTALFWAMLVGGILLAAFGVYAAVGP